MRKADYAHLARVLRQERDLGAMSVNAADTVQGKAAARARQATAETVARRFAAQASVNAPEFLRACGIDPP